MMISLFVHKFSDKIRYNWNWKLCLVGEHHLLFYLIHFYLQLITHHLSYWCITNMGFSLVSLSIEAYKILSNRIDITFSTTFISIYFNFL